MIGNRTYDVVRTWGLVAVSALAVVVMGAVADPDRSWARIRAMPMEQRTKLLQNLRRFDLELTAEKQQAIRDLDRRIAQLAPDRQFEYLAVLRRYHNWFSRLPENRQDELLSRPPAERMALVRKLVVDHAVPKADTPQVLRLAELGEYSPFELASIFKIWQAAAPAQREEIERLVLRPRRHEALFRLGDELGIPREIKPPKFDEERWVTAIEKAWRKNRPFFLLDEVVKKKQDTTRDEVVWKKLEARRRDILHRQAINFYLTKAEVRSVDPQRLVEFVSGLPPWVQTNIDQYPPDEARRRLSFAYRLVFPYPEELKPGRQPLAAPAKGRPVPSPKRVSPSPEKSKSDARTNAPF